MKTALSTLSLFLAIESSIAGEQGKTLLAIGDSIAAGQTFPDYIFRSGYGYNDVLFEHLQENYGFDTFADASCAAESTSNVLNATMGNTDCTNESPPFPSLCYAEFCNDENFFPPIPGNSQIDAAERYMESHPGEVGLITISLVANDLTPCLETPDVQSCIFSGIANTQANLPEIVTRLGAYGAPIIGSNVYNPALSFTLSDDPNLLPLGFLSEAIFGLVNDAVEGTYAALGVPVVDMFTAIHGTSDKLLNLCRHTGMCVEADDGTVSITEDLDITDDQHPNELGYSKIGQAFVELVDNGNIVPTGSPVTDAPTVSPTTGSPTASPVAPTSSPSLPVSPAPTNKTKGKKAMGSGKKQKRKNESYFS